MFEFVPNNYRWSYNTLLAFAAGGQFGDIALILDRLNKENGNDDVWHDAWSWLAQVLERRASYPYATDLTRSENLFAASLYHTLAEHFVPPANPARAKAYQHVLKCFDEARRLAPFEMESVTIPFGDATLPAYFLPALRGEGRRPTVIFICGLDTTKELWFLRARLQFAMRGMNSLFVDTPGIGGALRIGKLYTRADYEVPVGAAIDYLQSHPAVDADKIGIIGSSLGGYYVTRATAFEPRLKAAIAWGAIDDYHQVWMRRLQTGAITAAPSFQLMFITGKAEIEDAVAHVADFKTRPIAHRISVPFLVMHGADDHQVPLEDARSLYEAVGSSDKELVVFSGENGGAAHTQFDNHLPALQVAADWMASKLH
jgi:dipeptidyl aminopeptidase/acylaminoacyl peptidase